MGIETENETGSKDAPTIPPKIVHATARPIISVPPLISKNAYHSSVHS